MLAHNSAPPQPPGPSAAPWPADVPCPLCGRGPVPFEVRLSALLDQVEVLRSVVAEVRAAAQELAA